MSEETGKPAIFGFHNRDQAIEALCLKVFGARPFYRDSAPVRKFEPVQLVKKEVEHTSELERELAEVTKQRDALMEAMKEIAGGGCSWKTCVDVVAPRAIAAVEGKSITEVIENIFGVKIKIDEAVPNDTFIAKGGEG